MSTFFFVSSTTQVYLRKGEVKVLGDKSQTQSLINRCTFRSQELKNVELSCECFPNRISSSTGEKKTKRR
ncbi:hypothetical protein TYRP_005529 [Tyrophagus putrescentiae]|nr:hypothetical protein TYRP_005529 [Tyrophagus putrescentiae]